MARRGEIRIIPAINAPSLAEVRAKIGVLKDLTTEFHLDVASAEFTRSVDSGQAGHQTWANPTDLNLLDENLKLDLHLMLALKPQEILKWNNSRVKRFSLQLEASPNPDGLLKLAKKTGKEVYVVWSKNVEREFIERYVSFIDGILVLAVMPGKAGQTFLEEAYAWITEAQGLLSSKQKLAVDGGINRGNLSKVASYKPNTIIVSSAIYGAANPRTEFEQLKSLV